MPADTTTKKAPVKVGQEIRRTEDGRIFKVTFVNMKGLLGGVFSADAADGKMSGWGGPIEKLRLNETFEVISRAR